MTRSYCIFSFFLSFLFLFFSFQIGEYNSCTLRDLTCNLTLDTLFKRIDVIQSNDHHQRAHWHVSMELILSARDKNCYQIINPPFYDLSLWGRYYHTTISKKKFNILKLYLLLKETPNTKTRIQILYPTFCIPLYAPSITTRHAFFFLSL